MNTLTFDKSSGNATIKCALSVSVAVSMAFFSLLDMIYMKKNEMYIFMACQCRTLIRYIGKGATCMV